MFITEEIRGRLKTDNAAALTLEQLYDLIMAAITPSLPYLAHGGAQPIDIVQRLDYGLPSHSFKWKTVGEIPGIDNWVRIKADTCPGGSEGVYTDVALVTLDMGEYITTQLFTFKTLCEGPDAYVAMGALGGMISYALELFLMINY